MDKQTAKVVRRAARLAVELCRNPSVGVMRVLNAEERARNRNEHHQFGDAQVVPSDERSLHDECIALLMRGFKAAKWREDCGALRTIFTRDDRDEAKNDCVTVVEEKGELVVSMRVKK